MADTEGTANQPIVHAMVRFYFPPNTSFDDASAQVSAKLDGMDYTAVFEEILPEQRAQWMASAD